MRRQLLAGAAAICALLAAGSTSAQTYSRLVVFGDSLSDNGNLFRLNPAAAPPSPPYSGGRFSNGPTFVELLGFPLGVFGTVTGSTDYAFGGARTDLSGTPPGIRTQLNAYLAGGGKFGPNDLVSVYGGANNIFQGIGAAAVSPNPVAAITATTNAAAADLGLVISSVAAAGAGTILAPNLPSLGATPQFNGFVAANAAAGPLAEAATGAFNAALRAQVTTAAAANGGTNFIYMDVNSFDAWVRANPSAFGFSNTTTPCFTGTAVCSSPDQFLYWDSVHPTAAGHRGLAALTNDYLYYGTRGAPTAAMGETSLVHREVAQEAALERLDEAGREAGPRFSMALDVGRTNDEQRGDVPEIARDTAALRMSVNGMVAPGLSLGLQAHAAHSKAEAGALEFQTDSLGLDVYGGLALGPVFVNAVVGGSTDEYNNYRRRTGVGPIVHSADRVKGSSLGGKLLAGVRFPMGEAELSPRVGVSAIRTTVEAFSENGPAARHATREHDIEALGADVAVRLETPVADGRFRTHLEAGYGELFDYDGEVGTALADNPARPILRGVEAPGRGPTLKAGLSGEVFGGVQVGVGYQGRLGETHDSHAARIVFSYRMGG